MASGSNKAQEKNFRPGNSHTAVNHARLTPSSVTPHATPSASQNVLLNRAGSVVSTRCCQTSLVGAKNDERMVPTGISTIAAARMGIRRQRHEPRRSEIRKREEKFPVRVLFPVELMTSLFTLDLTDSRPD